MTSACEAVPQLGLVCLTVGPEVRFRTVTLSRYRALSPAEREAKLLDLYSSNIKTLRGPPTTARRTTSGSTD